MDNVIVKEISDGECLAQVGSVVVEESIDGEHKAEAGEEEAVKKVTGNTMVEENTDGECTSEVGEEGACKEIVGDAIVEESIDGEDTAQVEEYAIVKDGSDVKHSTRVEEETLKDAEENANRVQVGEELSREPAGGSMIVKCKDVGKRQVSEDVFSDTVVCNDTVEESTDGERTTRVRAKEMLSETVDTGGENKAQVSKEMMSETVGTVILDESADGDNKPLSKIAACDDIVEENIDSNYTTQVGAEEMLSETVGTIIFGESTDGENQTQVSEEVFNKMVVRNDIVEESIGGECTTHVGAKEMLSERVGTIILEESTDGEHKSRVEGEEMSNETKGYVIAEESTAKEDKAQVKEEEEMSRTVGNVIFEEPIDGEYKAEARKATALDETMDDIIVCESTGGEFKGKVCEEEAFDETADIIEEVKALNITVGVVNDESTGGEHIVEIRKEAMLDETMCDVIVEESTDGELKGEVREKEACNETKDIITESTDGEHVAQVREEEASNKPETQASQSMASGTLAENDQYVSYCLPHLVKSDFEVSDLVWGKVKSHPWWPGQIFDIADATKLAMKYQKNDSFLIGYFGDKTFAWCDESQLKPFHSYFSQLEKQCGSDTFVKAIHDILTEVARRVELGMACSCLHEEDYTDLKYQKVENAGIRGGNINSIINRSIVANYFQPVRLLEYIQELAQFPNGRVDRLEFVIAQSQLKALYHSKGYLGLPVFTIGGGLKESVPENSPSRTIEDIPERGTPILSDSVSAKGKLRSEQSSFSKQDHIFVGGDKHKSTFKPAEVRTGDPLENGGKSMFITKAAEKPLSYSSGKKHIIVESDPVDSGRCKKRMLNSFEDMEVKSPSPTVTSPFKIGEFIRRAASQLTGGPSIIKCQAEHKKDDIGDFDVFSDSPVGSQTINLSFTEDYSTEEMLLQLRLAAKNPMEESSFSSTIVAFFTGFRNYCVPGSSEDKEHVEKRKRGRPRKVIAQLASSDMGSSEDEKHIEKRKKGMLINVISQVASSDINSEDEKPVEKRKRGRPRKNPEPSSSDSYEDKNLVQKPRRGRPRGRPKKVDGQLACPDYSSSENKKLVERRKRGRPRKVNTEISPFDMLSPGHNKDSYWSDVDHQQKKNGKGPMQYQRKRRKSTGEKSLPIPSNPVQEIEQQLQLIAMNPNLKLTFIEERSIISVEEKIVDECMPTSLILSFNNANSLPSETELLRIFSRYGPLKKAETDVLTKSNCAKVVFKRRVDAETAFRSAGKYSIFGAGLLSYQLKPWTPRSILQGTLQGTQDAASTSTPQDAHDVTSIVTPQEKSNVVGNDDAAPTTASENNHDTTFVATLPDMLGLGSITTAREHSDLLPMKMLVLGNDDPAAISRPQDKCDSEPIEQNNLELSEQGEAVMASDAMQTEAEKVESSPHDEHASSCIASREGNQDAVLVTSSLIVCDLTPENMQENMDAAPITITLDNHNATGIITLQDKCDVRPSVGDTSELSEQAKDVIASGTQQVEAPDDNNDPPLIATQENLDMVPVMSQPTSTQEKLDAEPIFTRQDSHDFVATIGPTAGINLEISVQAEDVKTSDAVQAEAESKETSPHGRHDPIPIPHQKNLDAVPAASLLDEKYPVPTMTQDGVVAAPISMEQDGHDSTTITTVHRCIEGPTVGSDLHLVEQAEAMIASDFIQVEDVGKELTPQASHDSALISAQPEQCQDSVHRTSLLDEHDLQVRRSTHDNLVATPVLVQDHCNADAIIATQDKYDGEKLEDVIALAAMEIEPDANESLAEDTHDSTQEQNQDAGPVALLLDKHDSTLSTTQGSIDAATVSMPQDNQGAALPTAPHDNHDEAQMAPPHDNYDAEPVGTPQDNPDTEPATSLPPDDHDAALIAPPRDYHDAVSTATPPHYDVIAPTARQVSHHEAPVATPDDKYESAQINTTQECNDLAPITAIQDNTHAVAAISVQEKCDTGPTKRSNTKPTEQAEDAIQAVNDHVRNQPEDVITSDTIQVESGCKMTLAENNDRLATSASEQNEGKESIVSPLDMDDSTPSTVADNLDAEPISMPPNIHDPTSIVAAEDNHDDVSIATTPNYLAAPITTPHDNLPATSIATPDDEAPIPQAEGSPDLAHITLVEGNHDAAAIISPEDKYDSGSTIRSNLEIPEQAKDVIVSDTVQVEGGDEESLQKAKHDPPIIDTPQQNEGAESAAIVVEKHDSTPTTTEENLDGDSVDTAKDNHGAALITTPQDMSDAAIPDLTVSEQVQAGVALETIQLEPEGCILKVSGNR